MKKHNNKEEQFYTVWRDDNVEVVKMAAFRFLEEAQGVLRGQDKGL